MRGRASKTEGEGHSATITRAEAFECLAIATEERWLRLVEFSTSFQAEPFSPSAVRRPWISGDDRVGTSLRIGCAEHARREVVE